VICACEVLEGSWNVREGLGAWVGFSDWGYVLQYDGHVKTSTRTAIYARVYENRDTSAKVVIHSGDAYIYGRCFET
jgi:hypothetical protein